MLYAHKNMTKIAIVLYLYHTNLWNNFSKLLLPIKDHFKLYLCLCNENGSQKKIVNFVKHNFESTISFHDNYGADISSFLQTLEIIEEPYFIKLHSKKSLLGLYNQIEWRHILLHDFLGSKEIFLNNYANITDPLCGSIGNKNLLLTNNESYHSNQIKKLCDVLEINYHSVGNYSFFGGNMFMSKTKLFQKHFLPQQNVLQKFLSKEKNKVSEKHTGTYSHALERIFGYIVGYNNLNFTTVKHNTVQILNEKAPNGIFHMIKLYNDDCYLQEDINVYGHIIDRSTDNFSIQWKHIQSNPIQKYQYVGENTIVQKNG